MSDLEKFKSEMPTERWRKSMSDTEFPDEFFTEENIAETEKILVNYIDSLANIRDENEQGKIMKLVEEVVVKFNELNGEHDYFIETLEREELAEFIQLVAVSAGLVLENEYDDVTEEWREW